MKILFLLISMLSLKLMSCPFDERTISDLEQGHLFEKRRSSWSDIIHETNPFDELPELNQKKCEKSLQLKKFVFNHQNYLSLRSETDLCDGGNSNGVVFEEDDSGRFWPVAFIFDYEVYCFDNDLKQKYLNHNFKFKLPKSFQPQRQK